MNKRIRHELRNYRLIKCCRQSVHCLYALSLYTIIILIGAIRTDFKTQLGD
jgi:hypothetical protein